MQSADCIMHAKVISGSSRFEFGRIYTYYSLSALETLKGAHISYTQVRVPGGIVGVVAYVVPGSPDFSRNEEVVLFLKGSGGALFEMDGITSGLYRVTQDQGGQSYIVPSPGTDEPLLSADGHLLAPGRPMALSDFKAAIYHYLGQSVKSDRYAFPIGLSTESSKRKAPAAEKEPKLAAGNVQAGYSKILGRPVDIFWDLSRDYGPVKESRVLWYFNPDSIAGKSPYGVTPEQALEAVKWSFEQWNNISTASIVYQYEGSRRDIPNHKLDLVNIITFADSEYIYGIQKDAIASARPFAFSRRTYVGPEGLDFDQDGRIDFPDFPEGIWEAGTIIDCDVRWDVGGPYADTDFAVDNTPGALNMQGVFNHELGHFAGLVHTPIRDLGNMLVSGNHTPTMFSIAVPNPPDGSDNPMSTLELDDMISLSMLYPTPGFKSQFGSIEGKVVSGIDGKPVRGNFVAALSLPEGEPYRNFNDAYHRAEIAVGVFTDQEGNFRIQGLPPGEYVLGVQPMDDVPAGTNRNAFNTLVSLFGDTDFIWDEFYNGSRESAEEKDPFDYEPVGVTPGDVTAGIRFVTNVYPKGRKDLRRLFGERDYFVAANQLRMPFSPFSSTQDLVSRKFPQIFAAPYKVVSATCDFASNTAPPEGAQIIWPQIMLALSDPQDPSRPEIENPLAVIKNFKGDGTLLSTDPLPFDYPVLVDRPGNLWLVVRSPERRLNAFHNIDILGAGQDELQVDESFVSFDGGASFQSVMHFTVSWRMGVTLEGTDEREPLAEPRLVQSEKTGGAQAIRLHFATVKSLSGAAPPAPPSIRLRYTYRAEPYPQGSRLKEVQADPRTGALSFKLVRYLGRLDSTVYNARNVKVDQSGRKITGEIQVLTGGAPDAAGSLDLVRSSGFGTGVFDGIWEGTLGAAALPVKMDLVIRGSGAQGVLIWPAEAPRAPDTALVYLSAPGDTVVLIDSLPSNPAGFELAALDETGRQSPPVVLGLGDDFYEPNERLKDAVPVFPAYGFPATRHTLNSIRGTITAAKNQEDHDYFRFPLRQGDSVVVDIDAVSQRPFDPASSLDAFIEAFDSTGARFKGVDGREVLNDDENGLDPFATFVSPRDATCYLHVLDAAVAYGDRGDLRGANAFYELRLTVLPRKGDVIRDGVIRVDDALLALDLAGGAQQPDPQAVFAADMDGDGRVEIDDVCAVFRRALEEPFARSTELASAERERKGGNISLSCTEKAPGSWVVALRGDGGGPRSLMLRFLVSEPVDLAVLEPFASCMQFAATKSGGQLCVIVDFGPASTEAFSGLTGFIELRAGPQAQISLIDAVAGFPGQGEQATIIESGSPDKMKLPTGFSLSRNYPNPFNPSTAITYSVPPSNAGGLQSVTLEVFDLRGRRVRILASGPHEPGEYTVIWDGTDESSNPLSSGIYFYRLRAESFSGLRKMVMIR
ncbi:MAG TPA: FlgD immunoglobulin-like domain containing protein [archaeon]|nr:FlgD immunoglobulin-like domain containing protein [archaeon]